LHCLLDTFSFCLFLTGSLNAQKCPVRAGKILRYCNEATWKACRGRHVRTCAVGDGILPVVFGCCSTCESKHWKSDHVRSTTSFWLCSPQIGSTQHGDRSQVAAVVRINKDYRMPVSSLIVCEFRPRLAVACPLHSTAHGLMHILCAD
jgi:hypothetical protein